MSRIDFSDRRSAGETVTVAVSDSTHFALVWCPSGRFERGGHEGDAPQKHVVELSRGFWIGKTPITQEIWQATTNTEFRFRYGVGTEQLPVEAMSFQKASWFCETLNAVLEARGALGGATVRLPTDAEWEYATRAGTSTTRYFDGTNEPLTEHAWYCENSNDETHAVASKKPNPWGLFDVYGNVEEWCLDDYSVLSGTDVKDPCHRGDDSIKVVRGGGYTSRADSCRSGWRRMMSVDNPYSEETGIRIVVAQRA